MLLHSVKQISISGNFKKVVDWIKMCSYFQIRQSNGKDDVVELITCCNDNKEWVSKLMFNSSIKFVVCHERSFQQITNKSLFVDNSSFCWQSLNQKLSLVLTRTATKSFTTFFQAQRSRERILCFFFKLSWSYPMYTYMHKWYTLYPEVTLFYGELQPIA